MCRGCWERDGGHKIVNERTLKVAQIIADALDAGCDYGIAHIVLGDDNLEDHHIDSCLADRDEEPRDKIARECLKAMRALSWEERVSANAIGQEYLTEEELKELGLKWGVE